MAYRERRGERERKKRQIHLFDTESLRKCRGMNSTPWSVCTLGASVSECVCTCHPTDETEGTVEWHPENGYGEKQLMGETHTHTKNHETNKNILRTDIHLE